MRITFLLFILLSTQTVSRGSEILSVYPSIDLRPNSVSVNGGIVEISRSNSEVWLFKNNKLIINFDNSLFNDIDDDVLNLGRGSCLNDENNLWLSICEDKILYLNYETNDIRVYRDSRIFGFKSIIYNNDNIFLYNSSSIIFYNYRNKEVLKNYSDLFSLPAGSTIEKVFAVDENNLFILLMNSDVYQFINGELKLIKELTSIDLEDFYHYRYNGNDYIIFRYYENGSFSKMHIYDVNKKEETEVPTGYYFSFKIGFKDNLIYYRDENREVNTYNLETKETANIGTLALHIYGNSQIVYSIGPSIYTIIEGKAEYLINMSNITCPRTMININGYIGILYNQDYSDPPRMLIQTVDNEPLNYIYISAQNVYSVYPRGLIYQDITNQIVIYDIENNLSLKHDFGETLSSLHYSSSTNSIWCSTENSVMELDFNSLEILREYDIDDCYRIINIDNDDLYYFKRIEENTFNLCSFSFKTNTTNFLENPIYLEFIESNSYFFKGDSLIINPRGGDIQLIDYKNLKIESVLFNKINYKNTSCFEIIGNDLLVSNDENIYLVKDIDDVQLTDMTKFPIYVVNHYKIIYGIIHINNIVYFLDGYGRLWKCDKVTSVEELNYSGTPDRLPDINSLDIESINIYSIDGILTGTYLSVEDMYSNLTQQPGIVVVKTKTNKIYYYKLMR